MYRGSTSLTVVQDLITGDELISDSYDLKEVDGAVYEADCKRITIGNDNIDIGANPSAEEGGEDLDDEIVITEDGNRVSIRNAETGVGFGRLRVGSQGSAALDIEVPRSATLTFKTLSGDVIAEGIGRDDRGISLATPAGL